MLGGGPSNVVVSEGTADSLLVSWVPPNAHVLQYRVSYTALTGAEHKDRTVSGLFYWLFFILPVHVYYLCHRLKPDFSKVAVVYRFLSQVVKTGCCSSHYSQIHATVSWLLPSTATEKEEVLQLREKPVSPKDQKNTFFLKKNEKSISVCG